MCSAISKKIRNVIPARYKNTLQTIVVQEKEQDLRVVSKWLWDTSTDRHLTVKYRNSSMTVLTILHLIYLE